jgi:tetratricopeptide (TPR) repeat protein
LNPKDANAFFNRGNCHAKANDFKSAIADMAKAAELDSENGYYFRVLGNTKYQLDEMTQDPCADWQKASQLGDKKADFSIKRFCRGN